MTNLNTVNGNLIGLTAAAPKKLTALQAKTKQEAADRFYGEVKDRGYTALEAYDGANTKVTLRCPNNHEYKVKPASFKQGMDCTQCTPKAQVAAGKRFYKNLADRGFSTTDEYVGTKTKIRITCPNGHTRKQAPHSFLAGYGCVDCPDPRMERSKKLFMERASAEGYTVKGEYEGSEKHVLISCANGHDRQVRPADFMVWSGCKRCPWKRTLNCAVTFNESVEKRGYSIITPYVRNMDKLKLRCPVGHTWEVCPNVFLSPRNCGHCFDEKYIGKIMRDPVVALSERIAKRSMFSATEIAQAIDSEALRHMYDRRKKGSNVDHIIPLTWFNLDDLGQIAEANTAKNLQYLSGSANRKKSNNLTPECQIKISGDPALINLLAASTNIPKRWQAWAQQVLSKAL